MPDQHDWWIDGTDAKDLMKILKIIDRAAVQMPPINRSVLIKDLCMTHKWSPLDLDALWAADLVSFAHDINGIQMHMERSEEGNGRPTGRILLCFLPLCAILPQTELGENHNARHCAAFRSGDWEIENLRHRSAFREAK